MIIDSGWVKVSVRDGNDASEKILAVRGQGNVVGERAALTTQVRSATVTALDEVSAMVVPADRFAEFLRGHPRAVEVLQRQVKERQEEDRARLFPGERAGAERRLAWLLFDLAQRRGGYRHAAAAVFTLPMSQQELADWADTTADAVGRFLRSWRERGIIVRGERSRRLTVVDLDGLAAICDPAPPDAGTVQDRPADPAGNAQTPAARLGRQKVAGEAAPKAAARWFGAPGEPLNCSILFTDVAGFGNPLRLDPDREVVRAALYEILRSSFEASGVPWTGCYYEDRGDGAVIVVPPTISTLRVVDPLIPELAARLRQYNRRVSEVVLIQLRAALHVGPVGTDAEGLTGQAVISTARILDAPVVKERLADARADLIFAVSDYVYDHVVRHGAGRVDSGAFEHVAGQVKESYVSAWIHLAGRIELSPSPVGGGNGSVPLPVAPPIGKLPADVRGRDGLLGELRRALRSYPWRASRTFVITGMGGLGKSTVALAAAKMAKDRGYSATVRSVPENSAANRSGSGCPASDNAASRNPAAHPSVRSCSIITAESGSATPAASNISRASAAVNRRSASRISVSSPSSRSRCNPSRTSCRVASTNRSCGGARITSSSSCRRASSAPSSCRSSITSQIRSSSGARSVSSRSVIAHPSRSGAAVNTCTSVDPGIV